MSDVSGLAIANLATDELSHPNPVFHGDTLRCTTTIAEKRESKSRPDAGIVLFEHRAINQRGEEVAYCKRSGLMKKRPVA